jgi:hypothetical protein
MMLALYCKLTQTGLTVAGHNPSLTHDDGLVERIGLGESLRHPVPMVPTQ